MYIRHTAVVARKSDVSVGHMYRRTEILYDRSNITQLRNQDSTFLNISDIKILHFWTFQTSRFYISEHFRHQDFTFQNISDIKILHFWTFQTLRLYISEHFRHQDFTFRNISDIKILHFWTFQTSRFYISELDLKDWRRKFEEKDSIYNLQRYF